MQIVFLLFLLGIVSVTAHDHHHRDHGRLCFIPRGGNNGWEKEKAALTGTWVHGKPNGEEIVTVLERKWVEKMESLTKKYQDAEVKWSREEKDLKKKLQDEKEKAFATFNETRKVREQLAKLETTIDQLQKKIKDLQAKA